MQIEEKNTSRQQGQLFFIRFLDALSKDDALMLMMAHLLHVLLFDAFELGTLTSIHTEGAGGVLLPLQKGQFRLDGALRLDGASM